MVPWEMFGYPHVEPDVFRHKMFVTSDFRDDFRAISNQGAWR